MKGLTVRICLTLVLTAFWVTIGEVDAVQARPAGAPAYQAADMLFVAAAGNGGFDGNGDDNDRLAFYPSRYLLANVVAVAATDADDLLAPYSNFGDSRVDLGAPGSDILSTLPGDRYGLLSGTSMATPHVAGVVSVGYVADPEGADKLLFQPFPFVGTLAAVGLREIESEYRVPADAATGSYRIYGLVTNSDVFEEDVIHFQVVP